MPSTLNTEALEALTRINLEDVLISFGLNHLRGWLRRAAETPFRPAARRFAQQVLDYDQQVQDYGLHLGAQHFLSQYIGGLTVEGAENIPAHGPLLLLSNHPGMTDTVALFAAIPRADLRIVAAERPFLHALPATARQLIWVPDDSSQRLNVVRSITEHLRSGGAILTFPAGSIEPDPASLPGALETLTTWSSSVGLFARLVPTAHILPVIVSGVLAPQSLRHPLTRLRHTPADRQRLAATLQILDKVHPPARWREQVTVRFATPISAAELAPLRDPQAITAAVVERIRPFLAQITSEYDHVGNGRTH